MRLAYALFASCALLFAPAASAADHDCNCDHPVPGRIHGGVRPKVVAPEVRRPQLVLDVPYGWKREVIDQPGVKPNYVLIANPRLDSVAVMAPIELAESPLRDRLQKELGRLEEDVFERPFVGKPRLTVRKDSAVARFTNKDGDGATRHGIVIVRLLGKEKDLAVVVTGAWTSKNKHEAAKSLRDVQHFAESITLTRSR